MTKHAAAVLSCELLKFIRDTQPGESAILEWLGVANAGRYHKLRRSNLLLLVGDRVVLSSAYLSPDGTSFAYDNRVFNIDEGEVLIVRRSSNET